MILIASRLLDFVGRQARQAVPAEACGLLTGQWQGRNVLIRRAIASRNLAHDRRSDRFEIDPVLHIRLQRRLRGTAEAVVGVYHSHPSGDASPSKTDIAEAAYDGWVWLIAAIRNGECNSCAYIVSTADRPATFQPQRIDPAAGRRWIATG